MSKGLTLPSLVFGDISIRSMVVKDSRGSYSIVHPQNQTVRVKQLAKDEFPIFLAKDVCNLLESGHQSGVMTRFLRKTQDFQFSTKVHFKGIRVEGINNSSTLNFVSVKAVYMALFSGNNTELQKRIIPHLWDVWMAGCEISLPAEMDYVPDRVVIGATSTADVTKDDKPLDELLHCLDTCQNKVDYCDSLRSLLNSYRSLYFKYGTADFNRFLKKEEELIQSLIKYNSRNCTDIEDAVLDVASGWIGREFSAMNDFVQNNVDKFKRDNIQSIDKLPSAQITCSYFPKAMVTLFENWLALGHRKRASDEMGAGEPARKSKREASTDIYPFIQLLLEFANNSLISGVAHVVYTQLLKDPT